MKATLAIFTSAILFGLVHPGSKLLMGQGLKLLPFCFLYVGIRLLAQLPLVVRNKSWKIRSRKELYLLMSLGIVGVCLQLAEFCGVYSGLPVGVVSFLVYTHPIWTILLSRIVNGEAISAISVIKLALAVTGIILITGFRGGFPIEMYWMPLTAGIFIALWISLSNKASKSGSSAGSISFYYDSFSFLILGVLIGTMENGTHFFEALHFMKDPQNLILISGYSILIGYLPNFLFYWGSKQTNTQVAGFTLLLEPVMSTAVSHFTWSETISETFLIGAILILSTNLPLKSMMESIMQFFRSTFLRPSLVKAIAKVLYAFALSLTLPNMASGAVHSTPTLNIIEIVPADPADYTVTKELEQLRLSSNMAVLDFKNKYPKCRVKVEATIKRGTEAELYSRIEQIGKDSGAIVVGLSRSNFARLAAKALSGTNSKGISVGAAFSNLSSINPNFVSIVSPWERQWEALMMKMRENKCDAKNTVGVFDSRNILSQKFEAQFTTLISGLTLKSPETSKSQFSDRFKESQCIFLALNFSEAQGHLLHLVQSKWQGTVFGIGDWNYYASELEKTLATAKDPNFTVIIPTGWLPEVTNRSRSFSQGISKELGESPSPLGAYTYDATWLALEDACNKRNILKLNSNTLSTLPLLRQYEGLSTTGNFLSEMFVITKKGRP